MAYLFAADRHDHLYNDLDGVYKLIGDNKSRYQHQILFFFFGLQQQYQRTIGICSEFESALS